MLEHIFGSNTRVKILNVLYQDPKKVFFVRQLARETGSQLNSIRREIANLKSIGVIIEAVHDDEKKSEETPPAQGQKPEIKKNTPDYIEKLKKYYAINQNFLLYHELRALILKSRLFAERNFIKKIENISSLQLLLFTGIFVGMEKSKTDMLLVGSVEKKKMLKIIEEFEKELNQKINYTIMTSQEYKYRKEITDRFLYDILETKNIVLIDKTNPVNNEKKK